jgi:NAD(P) transhydrogenase subunit alpha
LFDFDEIRVHSRRPESRAAFGERLSRDLGKPVRVVADWESCVRGADMVVEASRLPEPKVMLRAGWIKKGALVISIMDPYGHEAALKALADAGVTAFAMELMPRITRAQSMDVLSSQANLAGYRAVIDASAEYGRAFPMMMTAAGTVPAARVFIMGVGVAGLQAIATARRLGAVVTATDVRPATKEQVESLGAKFLAVEDEEFKNAQTAGGYAKEMSKEYQAKQAALVAEHIKKQDIVITTALIPGRPAPRLISREMAASMRPGSVIVDLAVERGGNVEGAKAGAVATAASRAYIRTASRFLQHRRIRSQSPQTQAFPHTVWITRVRRQKLKA